MRNRISACEAAETVDYDIPVEPVLAGPSRSRRLARVSLRTPGNVVEHGLVTLVATSFTHKYENAGYSQNQVLFDEPFLTLKREVKSLCVTPLNTPPN